MSRSTPNLLNGYEMNFFFLLNNVSEIIQNVLPPTLYEVILIKWLKLKSNEQLYYFLGIEKEKQICLASDVLILNAELTI